MMAPEYYIFIGERVPEHVTHVLIDRALKFVPARAFESHLYIEEVICHDGVEKIEEYAFYDCPRLRRVIMPGVKNIEKNAFNICLALTHIECGKLEIIGEGGFRGCPSLNSIDLPSIKVVEDGAFNLCQNLANAKLGKDLESIGERAFRTCRSLERISLPLKGGVINDDGTFQECNKLNQVDLVGGVQETIAALLMEQWKNDMNEELENINRILPNTPAGNFYDVGGKAQAMKSWIRSVRPKIVHYKAEHRRYLNVAAATLQPALPNDILFKNVLPFIELPSFTFEGEN